MAVEISAPELATALDRLGVSADGMTSQELAECLLVEAIASHLQERREPFTGDLPLAGNPYPQT